MWMQGEHIALIGRTGTGKTTLLEALTTSRRYAINLLTKSDDLAWRKFRVIRTAREMDSVKPDRDGAVRLILRSSRENRAKEFRDAIKRAYGQGGWTVGVDELYEMQLLGLEPELIQLYSEGRSENVTIIGGMQRPSWVTRNGQNRWATSQATHVFGWQIEDEDRATVAKLLGRPFADQVSAVSRYQFAYYNTVSKARSSGTVKDWAEVFK